jgi:hypothetical protein
MDPQLVQMGMSMTTRGDPVTTVMSLPLVTASRWRHLAGRADNTLMRAVGAGASAMSSTMAPNRPAAQLHERPAEHLGQQVPLLNLVVDENRACAHRAHPKIPGRCSSLSGVLKGVSMGAVRRRTAVVSEVAAIPRRCCLGPGDFSGDVHSGGTQQFSESLMRPVFGVEGVPPEGLDDSGR